MLFAVGSDGEVSEPLEVNALSCDTVEQVKEKILSTFKAKFGFPYNTPLREVCIGKQQTLLFSPVSLNTETSELTRPTSLVYEVKVDVSSSSLPQNSIVV